MAIKQFNGEWVCNEDRILFRFNTSEGQEFRFWLTRYIVKNFIAGCQSLAVQVLEKSHPPQVAQAMQEFKQQSLTQQLNFKQTYEPQAELPLGEAPALVQGLNITQQGTQVSIDFQTAGGPTVNLRITEVMLRMMVSLLDRLQAAAQWDIGTTPKPTASTPVTEMTSPLMH
jgi:hypothetical protein